MWSAIRDTGATKSCITQRVVDDLKLIPVGRTTTGTANGATEADTYFINIGLPNGVMVPNILVPAPAVLGLVCSCSRIMELQREIFFRIAVISCSSRI